VAAIDRGVVLRWWFLVLLAVGSLTRTGRAESTDSARIALTTRAWNASTAAEQALSRVSARWNALNAKFRVELDDIARLKNAPRSWRRDRDLRAKLADAEALGKQLEAASAEVRRATERMKKAHRLVVQAIDAELAAGPTAARRSQLVGARARVAPRAPKARRIVLPDTKIDPLADPEELDQQALSIHDSEVELQRQIQGLDAQADELDQIAMLRKQHERTRELDQRDDNSARKGATSSAGRGANADSAAPPESPSPGGVGGAQDVGSFESDASITLADVVDPTTIEELSRAHRSNDPAKRAAAVRRARAAVARKLAQLRARRHEVEQRASHLRKH